MTYNVDIRFSDNNCFFFFQIWNHFLLFWESGKKFIQLCIEFWVNRSIFLTANQYSKITSILSKIKKRAPKLRVNETKLASENVSNWDHFGFGVNNKSNCDERSLFQVSLQNLDLYFNPWTTDNIDICFFSQCFLFQILSHLLLF